MNVSLPEPMKSWVESRARTGQYSNVSDYVRDLIRRDQDRAQAVAEIQALADAGVASGPAQPFDMGRYLDDKTSGQG